MFKPILGEQFGDGLLRRVDRFLLALPKSVMVVTIVCSQLVLLYAYSHTGPWVPLGLFFIFNLYLSAKYVGSEFSYVMAFMTAAGRTYIKIGFYSEDAHWFLGHWQFISSYTLYTLFCYLINSQIAGRRSAERALDELAKLSEAVISKTDSGVLVLDERGRCVIINPSLAQLLHVRIEELQGRTLAEWGDVIPQELRESVHVVSEEGASRQLTLCVGMPEAQAWTVVSVSRIAYDDRSFVLMVFSDISAFKASQDAALAAANRAREAEHQLVNIGEQVQRRVGQELHDDLGQHLVGAAFVSEVVSRQLKETGHAVAQDAARVTAMINEAMAKTRYLSQGLYPDELKEGGFCEMMDKLATSVEAMHQVECEFHCECAQVPDDAETVIHLFRIAQEAINNAIRHGGAKHISLVMESDGKGRRLVIEDDGCGFGNATLSSKGGGLGMHTMRCRADMMGAQFSLTAPKGGGTRITIEMPHKDEKHGN